MLHENSLSPKIFRFFTVPAFIFFFYFLNILYPATQKPEFNVSEQEKIVNFDINFTKFASVGQYRLLSSLLWVETLLFSDIEKYKEKDLRSWIYLRLKTITQLDPLFYDAYIWGGMYLAIIKDDLKGAADIYEDGLRYFPKDLYLNFNAAFNYYHQLHNYPRAIELFEQIKDHPKAPPFLNSLIAKLKANTGNIQDAFLIVKTAYETAPKESLLKKKLFKDLYSIKAEIDLKCLNAQKNGCSTRDLEGQFYLYQNGKYKALNNWKPYRYMASQKEKDAR